MGILDLPIPTQAKQLQYLAPFPGAQSRRADLKMADFDSLLDVANMPAGSTFDATSAFAVIDEVFGEKIVPKGTYLVTSDLSLSNTYRFQTGAIVKIISPAVIHLDRPTILANDRQQVFDLSESGPSPFTGTLDNDYHSAKWFGILGDGSTPEGLLLAKVFSLMITPTLRGGLIHVRSTTIVNGIETVVNQVLPADTALLNLDEAPMTISSPVDGAAGTQLLVHQVGTTGKGAIENLVLQGPGAGFTSTAVFGNYPKTSGGVEVQMEGLMIGGGTGLQVKYRNVTVQSFRNGIVGWTTNGHSEFVNVSTYYNGYGWWFLLTGGDWSFTNCSSAQNFFAAHGMPRNGNIDQKPAWRQRYNSYQEPYWFYVPDADDLRPGMRSYGGSVTLIAWDLENVSMEIAGNAFIYGAPATSDFYQFYLKRCNYDFGDGSSKVSSMPSDYAINGSYCEQFDVVCAGGVGVGAILPADVGTFGFSGGYGIRAKNFVIQPSYSGKTWLKGPAASAVFIEQGYTNPQVPFPANATSATYTLSDAELCSIANLSPKLYSDSAPVPNARCYFSGGTLVIQLDAPLSTVSDGNIKVSLFDAR